MLETLQCTTCCSALCICMQTASLSRQANLHCGTRTKVGDACCWMTGRRWAEDSDGHSTAATCQQNCLCSRQHLFGYPQGGLDACFESAMPLSMCIMCLAELKQQLAHGITPCFPSTTLLVQNCLSACQQLLSAFLPLLHDAVAMLCKKLFQL